MDSIPVLNFKPPNLLYVSSAQLRANFMATTLGQLPEHYRQMMPMVDDDLPMHLKYQKAWDAATDILRKCNQDRRDDPKAYSQMIVDGLKQLEKGEVSSTNLLKMGIQMQDEQRQSTGNSFLKKMSIMPNHMPGKPAA